jgi:hypothetical protein
MRRWAWGVAALGLATAVTASGQRLGVSRTVLLTVENAQGRPVIDLLPDDFVIEEGGQQREVLDARLADYPVVLLVDNGIAAQGAASQIHDAVSRFVDRLGVRPLALGHLSNPPGLLTKIGDGRAAVLSALDGLIMSPARSSLTLGIAAAARMVTAGHFPFSAIVALSEDPTDAGGTPDQIMQVVSDSRVSLYVIARRQDLRDAASAGLASLADQTGGSFTRIFTPASYEAALDEVADRLTTELLVQFLEPTGASPSDDVRVGVRLRGAKVTAIGITPP